MTKEFKGDPSNIFYSMVPQTYNNTMPEQPVSNNSILAFLLLNFPNYIEMVPSHWLSQDMPSHGLQAYVSVAFLIIGIPANIGHLLVFLAFVGYAALALLHFFGG